MPRPKRDVRASGVARSLGAANRGLVRCPSCKRRLPRESIAQMLGPKTTRRLALGDGWHGFCGQCFTTDAWVRWLAANDPALDVDRPVC